MPSSKPSSSPTRGDVVFIDAGSTNEDTSLFSDGTWTFTVPSNTEIKGTATPQYFRSHRSSPSFTYTIGGLDSGKMYTISLGFAETWYKNCNIGKRIMSIGINNAIVNPELDVYKEVGCRKPYVDTFTATATPSGRIIIDFDTIVENAMVSTIQIEKKVNAYIDWFIDHLFEGVTRTTQGTLEFEFCRVMFGRRQKGMVVTAL